MKILVENLIDIDITMMMSCSIGPRGNYKSVTSCQQIGIELKFYFILNL